MKKIITLALAAVAALGISASAQDSRQCPMGKQECPQAPGDNNKMYKPQTFTDFAFEGILLDIPQQTRVDSLNAAFKAKREAAQCDNKDCKRGDKPCKRMCQGRTEYIKAVKDILTPEQYTTFLENIVFNAAPQQGPAQRRDMIRAHQGHKKQFKQEAPCKNKKGDMKKGAQKKDGQKK